MDAAVTTHLKLFLDQDDRQVALFSGPSEAEHWQRNMPATAVIKDGWDVLPKEVVISIGSVRQQGFLADGFLDPGFNHDAIAMAWSLRAARMAATQSEQASAAGEASADGDSCMRVVKFIEQAAAYTDDSDRLADFARQRVAWLVRGVNAHLNAWEKDSIPEHAEAVAKIFAALAQDDWPCESDLREKARHNQFFWGRRAVDAWGGLSSLAEKAGDFARAEAAAVAVLRSLDGLVNKHGS